MVDRHTLLEIVHTTIPQLYPFLDQCYRDHSHLVWNTHNLHSQRGVQQGDPLGPPLFCLVIHPLITQLQSEFNTWYLDDGTLGGDPDTVLKDFLHIITESHKLGVELNPDKCEIAILGPQTDNTLIVDHFRNIAPGIQLIDNTNAELLGAPLTLKSIARVFEKKTKVFGNMSTRLTHLPSHVAFFLLKHSLAIPRLIYLLRVTPMFKMQHLLQDFDTLLHKSLKSITNCKFDQAQLEEITLPVKMGGLGIPQTQTLATPCFISSLHSTSVLSSSILPSYINSSDNILLIEGLELWRTLSNTDTPMYYFTFNLRGHNQFLITCAQTCQTITLHLKTKLESLPINKKNPVLGSTLYPPGTWAQC